MRWNIPKVQTKRDEGDQATTRVCRLMIVLRDCIDMEFSKPHQLLCKQKRVRCVLADHQAY